MKPLAQQVAELQARLRNSLEEMEDNIEAALFASGVQVAADAKRGAPVDTGLLRNSITPQPVEKDGNVYTEIVSTNVEYAPFVEQNHPSNAKFMENALKKNEAATIRRVKKALKEAIE